MCTWVFKFKFLFLCMYMYIYLTVITIFLFKKFIKIYSNAFFYYFNIENSISGSELKLFIFIWNIFFQHKMATLDSRLFKLLAVIFNQSQDSSAGHEKLISKCQQLYKEVTYYLTNPSSVCDKIFTFEMSNNWLKLLYY